MTIWTDCVFGYQENGTVCGVSSDTKKQHMFLSTQVTLRDVRRRPFNTVAHPRFGTRAVSSAQFRCFYQFEWNRLATRFNKPKIAAGVPAKPAAKGLWLRA